MVFSMSYTQSLMRLDNFYTFTAENIFIDTLALDPMASQGGLQISGIRYIVRIHVLLFIQAGVFFAAAGTVSIPRAWLFFGMGIIYYPVSTAIVYWKNLQLINQRGESKQDTKSWDRILAPLYFFIGYFLIAAVIGMDVGRYTWTSLSSYYILPGIMLYVGGGILNTWAMVINPHFESTVRIQKERDHAVVSTGPYHSIRHPGYCAGIAWTLSIPLIIGSLLGFIPAIIGIFVLLFRTYLEDETLQRELPGYTEYTKKVTDRIVPHIW